MRVVRDHRRHRETEQQSETEQERDASCSRPRELAMFRPKTHANAPMKNRMPDAATQVATDVRAERGKPACKGDQAHDLAEHRSRLIARQRGAVGR